MSPGCVLADANCFERRHSHAEVRQDERAVALRARDGEDADALVWPERRAVPKWFRDKLSPAERWLRSQSGRPWDHVRSEMAARFDTRTLAGRHIVFDHLLPPRWRNEHEWNVARGIVRFSVDPHGVLRVREVRRKGRWKNDGYVADAACAYRFVDGRRVLRRGAALYWGIGIRHEGDVGPSCFRQSRALTPSERETFEALSAGARALVEIVYA